MSRRNMAIVAVCFGIAYAVASAIRSQLLAGAVSGAIGAVLVFVVLVRVGEHNAEVRRRRRSGGH